MDRSAEAIDEHQRPLIYTAYIGMRWGGLAGLTEMLRQGLDAVYKRLARPGCSVRKINRIESADETGEWLLTWPDTADDSV